MFTSAKLKVERAEHHIADLESRFKDFIDSHPDALTVAVNSESTTIKPSQDLPVELSLIAADAVHNLRTSLDHATWELRGLDGGKQNRWTKLPVADERVDYEGLCKGIKTPTNDLPEFFKGLEIFKMGKGKLIWALHNLDVIDKHIILSVAAQRISQPSFTITPERGGQINVFGGTFDLGEGATMFKIGGASDVKMYQNANTSVDIVFGNVDGFQFKPVIPTLVHLRDAVNDVIGQFEALASSRKK
jgi:hypothetical protein